MSKPWTYGPKKFVAPGGAATLIQLNVPHRGTIRSLRVNTTTDSITGPFEIYNSEEAATAAVASELTAVTGDDSLLVGNYMVCSGALVGGLYSANTLNVPYENVDGTPTNCIGRLWMRLLPSGSGNLNFGISMTIDTPAMT